MPGDYHEDWDLDGLFTQLEQIYPVSYDVDDVVEGEGRESLMEKLREDVVDAYDEREEELGDELMRALERFMLLQIIDDRWREHLHDMDYLREGIHLRGFAQIDPLVAYKNEGFEMFTELMNNIWDEFARYIFNVEVSVEAEQQQAGPQWGARPERHLDRLVQLRRRPLGPGQRRDRRRGGRSRRRRGRGRPRRRADDQPAAGRRDPSPRREREDRPQRPVLVRVRQEVQEVPWRLSASGLRDQLKLLADYL